MTDESTNSVRIGELLISVGVLTTGDLTEAIQISKRMGVPIGRVLVMSGCVSEANLQQALKLQSFIKDGMVDLETGVSALKLVFKDKIELEDALKTFNWTPAKDASSNKLGDLLVDASIVSRNQLEKALEASFQAGMPLGGTLVLQGFLSPQLLPTVLHTQEQIREGKMTRDEAIETLKLTLMYWAKAGESKEEELQSFPGSASKPAQASAQQFQAPAPAPAAQQFQAPAPAPAPAPAAQQFQAPPPVQPSSASQMAQAPYMPPGAAPSPAPVGQAAAPPVVPGSEQGGQANMVSLVELMKISGFCTQESLEKAVQDALNDNRLASKLLLSIGFVDSDTLNTYIKCQAMIARGILRTDQVLYVLNSIRHRKITFEAAVAELGIQVPV